MTKESRMSGEWVWMLTTISGQHLPLHSTSLSEAVQEALRCERSGVQVVALWNAGTHERYDLAQLHMLARQGS